MSFMIPNADDLVSYLKDFTGSSDSTEIRQCIFQAELMLRNIELPSLRSSPYDSEYIGTVGNNSQMDIPQDMNKPILFFQIGNSAAASGPSNAGPWIVYDRIGDRDIITLGLVAQFYLNPVNVPQVIRGKFSEVGNKYQFVPAVSQGTQINMYYYKAWNLLFTPTTQTISTTGTVGTISGSAMSWSARITGMTTTVGLAVGDSVSVTAGTGSLGPGSAVVTGIVSSTEIAVAVTGTTPVAGTVTAVNLLSTVQSNPVLQSFPEGYVYGALHEYYVKRHSPEDAQIYKSKYDLAVATVEDQNNLGKWSGGSTRMTSIFQPRRSQNYSLK
jgi:hypothetical protein